MNKTHNGAKGKIACTVIFHIIVHQPSASSDLWHNAHWTRYKFFHAVVHSASYHPGKAYWVVGTSGSAVGLTRQRRKSFAYVQAVAFWSAVCSLLCPMLRCDKCELYSKVKYIIPKGTHWPLTSYIVQ